MLNADNIVKSYCCRHYWLLPGTSSLETKYHLALTSMYNLTEYSRAYQRGIKNWIYDLRQKSHALYLKRTDIFLTDIIDYDRPKLYLNICTPKWNPGYAADSITNRHIVLTAHQKQSKINY